MLAPDENVCLKATCYLCKGLYTEPKQVTKCRHVFCSKCLKNYLKTKKRLGNNYPPCPLCRTPITKRLSEVDLLEAAIKEEELANLIRKLKCELCQSTNTALKKCLNCSTFVCNRCEFIHNKLVRDHSVVFLTESDILKQIHRQRECKVHKNQFLDLYCLMCNTCLCKLCDRSSHVSCNKEYECTKSYLTKLESSTCLVQHFLAANPDRKTLLDALKKCTSIHTEISASNESKEGGKGNETTVIPITMMSLRVTYVNEFSSFTRDYFTELLKELINDVGFFRHYSEELNNVKENCRSSDILVQRLMTFFRSIELIIKEGEKVKCDIDRLIHNYTDVEVASVAAAYDINCMNFFRHRKYFSFDNCMLKLQSLSLPTGRSVVKQTATCLLEKQNIGRTHLAVASVSKASSRIPDRHTSTQKIIHSTEISQTNSPADKRKHVILTTWPDTCIVDDDIPILFLEEYNKEKGRQSICFEGFDSRFDPHLPTQCYLSHYNYIVGIKAAAPDFLNFEVPSLDQTKMKMPSKEDTYVYEMIKSFFMKEDTKEICTNDNSVHSNVYLETIDAQSKINGYQKVKSTEFVGLPDFIENDSKCECYFDKESDSIWIKKTVEGNKLAYQTDFINLQCVMSFQLNDHNSIRSTQSVNSDIACYIGTRKMSTGLESVFIQSNDRQGLKQGIAVKAKRARFKHSTLFNDMHGAKVNFFEDENDGASFLKVSTRDTLSFISFSTKTDRKDDGLDYSVFSEETTGSHVPVFRVHVDLLCELKSGVYCLSHNETSNEIIFQKLNLDQSWKTTETYFTVTETGVVYPPYPIKDNTLFTVTQEDLTFPLESLKPITVAEGKNGEIVVMCAVEGDKENIVMILPISKSVEILEIHYPISEHTNENLDATMVDMEMDSEGNIVAILESSNGDKWRLITKYTMP